MTEDRCPICRIPYHSHQDEECDQAQAWSIVKKVKKSKEE